MNISRNWLKEFVDIEATDREYDEIMTIAGQKVETTTRMDAEIKKVDILFHHPDPYVGIFF